MRREPEESHKVSGSQNETKRSQSVFPKDSFFFDGCGGVFPKDSMIIFPSRWLAVAASERKRGDVHCAAWPPDP